VQKKEKTMATSVVENQTAKAGKLKVEMTRVIKASRQRVFDAWTRPEVIRQWFGPGPISITEADTDARADGEYSISTRGVVEPGGPERSGHVTGRYVRVEPYDLLAFTWKASWSPDEESLVTVMLRDVEGGTEMKLVHEGFATAESQQGHSHGWSNGLDKLQRLLETN
jgi:uncharacterized protein YndB with AHSA1/START domain